MSLQDKVVIITGASAGIGRDLAQRLAKEKATLVLAARSEDKLQQLSDELSAGGTDVLVVRTDVSDPNDLIALVNRTPRVVSFKLIMASSSSESVFNRGLIVRVTITGTIAS